ncbi:glycosyl hydrolases family 38 N-terminal domain-containing protein [Mycena alexandri]|uniref:Alpha-mannosidase n=1 Tax=Mycena alexandri TaxID=1745969 RepID=A0AAD6WMN8_9AGAR|nr:glycosyl hydrolases family 38 N-terminal domain-containing protein [Mycena alexandri]
MSYHSRGPTRPPQVQPFNNPNMHPAVAGARNAPNVQPNIHATPHQHQHTRPTAPSTNPTTDNTSMNTSKEYPTLNPSPGAKWIKRLTQDRLGQFNGGHFGDVNLGAAMYKRVEEGEGYVQMKVWSAPGLSKPSFDEALSHRADFKPAKKGDSFGPSWTNHWWIVHLVLPQEDFDGEERVTFEFDPGCEAMIFDVEGTPLQGITGGYGGDRRVEYIIPPAALAKGSHDIVIESSCNGMFGMGGGGIGPPDPNRTFTLASAALVVPNADAWRLWWDFVALREVVDAVGGNTSLQNAALTTANAIMNAFDIRDPSSILRARQIAQNVFGKDWDKDNDWGADVYDGADEGSEIGRSLVWGIGHCHIDTAWLWPYSVTQQKTARSWATQLDLMERYPEHRFACSQAVQWKWLEQQYPTLFTRIAAQVKAKKFYPIGGAWVEHDANMPSGEALVRQMLYGQRYFEKKFGVRCETGWLPDSFGLTGALPQLLRGAGMKYFFTQKLSWNNINTFPHSTFNWVGIDGTQVLCHMTPVDTYTAQATVGDVNRAISNHKNLESSDTSLLVFGNGDGGGGPLPKMLENLRRIRAVTNTHRELPPVVMGRSVDEFFDHLSARSDAGKVLPNWRGELYLEFHRGTYTSHGSIKKGNRHSEILLRDVEHVATLASLARSKKYVYPQQKLNDAWEKVLLNQFHDVLPGSAIGMVYDDAEKLYAEVREACEEMLDDALDVILGGHTRPAAVASTLDALVAYNTTFFARREVVRVPLPSGNRALRTQVAQLSADGKEGYAVVHCAGGARPALLAASPVTEAWGFTPVSVYTNGADHFVLRNASVQLTISKGRITSLLDCQLDRELIQEGATGGLVVFEDRPNFWDAWDVEIHHLEKATQLEFSNVSVVAQGPLRASVRAEVEYGQSRISVTISLDAVPASTKLDSRSMFRFDAWVDWHQRHEFLKFEIPLSISSDNATYETQFGWVQRPTHKNTTWDMAKFEVCGHKYADLSEYGYGVALLSESKYGFSCQGNVLRISLLRAATEPDADQDQGEHRFSWAVLPHKGHFLESDVPTAAYLFNSPLYIRALAPGAAADTLATHSPFAVINAPNVILETVKRGEDDVFKSGGKATIVLRLYEAFGGHAQAQLRIADGLGVEDAYETNLLEDVSEGTPLAVRSFDAAGGERELGLNLTFRGFEVKTIILVLGKKLKAEKKRESWVTVDA